MVFSWCSLGILEDYNTLVPTIISHRGPRWIGVRYIQLSPENVHMSVLYVVQYKVHIIYSIPISH